MLPPLINAPFVVSDSIFINPKYRGTRVIEGIGGDPEIVRDTYFRKQIRIYNARELNRAPCLEVEGFQLLNVRFPNLDFSNLESVTNQYYKYCCNLVKRVTGCVATRVAQHEFRFGKVTGPAGMGTYAHKAHADFCPYLEDVEGTRCMNHFAMYNIWRSIDPTRNIESKPLALCDITTVNVSDLVYVDSTRRTEPSTQVILCSPIHNPKQCWYYFPQMTPNEALIFKQYDTREENASRRSVFHAAFNDPTTQKGTLPPLPRKSIEVRIMAIFAERDANRKNRKERFKADVPTARFDGSVSEWRYERMVDWIYG